MEENPQGFPTVIRQDNKLTLSTVNRDYKRQEFQATNTLHTLTRKSKADMGEM